MSQLPTHPWLVICAPCSLNGLPCGTASPPPAFPAWHPLNRPPPIPPSSSTLRSPECFNVSLGGVSPKCDIFSFGVILWELITQSKPWDGLSEFQVWEVWEMWDLTTQSRPWDGLSKFQVSGGGEGGRGFKGRMGGREEASLPRAMAQVEGRAQRVPGERRVPVKAESFGGRGRGFMRESGGR